MTRRIAIGPCETDLKKIGDAAKLTGKSEPRFVLDAAVSAADRIIQEQLLVRLDPMASVAFYDAANSARRPSELLIDIMTESLQRDA